MSNFEQAQFSVTQQGTTQRIGGARVDDDFFSTLQSMPELGRTFAGEDNLPAHAKVAVISHSLWVSMFGARPDVLNRSIQLDGANYQIVGVMPPEFEYPFKSDLPYGDSHIESTQIWVPLALRLKSQSIPRHWEQCFVGTAPFRCVHSSGAGGDGRHHGTAR